MHACSFKKRELSKKYPKNKFSLVTENGQPKTSSVKPRIEVALQRCS